MIASAPGKLVISGAYVVLDGAPAVVAAIDRYAIADTSRPAEIIGDEVRAAFGDRPPPHVDVSALRQGDRKLGVGSSAAALVASIAAARGTENHEQIAREAFLAHRLAQGGGSGIDVVACTYGGVVVCRAQKNAPPSHESIALPPELVLEAWLCPTSASTSALLLPVRAFAAADPARYRDITEPGAKAAEQILPELLAGNIDGVVGSLRTQAFAIGALGKAVSLDIVPAYVRALFQVAERERAAFFPSGAGGGDIAIFAGHTPSSPDFRGEARALGLVELPLVWGAHGAKLGNPSADPRNLLSTSPPRFPT